MKSCGGQAEIQGGKVAPAHSLAIGGRHRQVPVQVRERSSLRSSSAREIANSGRGKRLGQMEKHTRRHPHPSPSRSPVLQPHESQSDHMRHI